MNTTLLRNVADDHETTLQAANSQRNNGSHLNSASRQFPTEQRITLELWVTRTSKSQQSGGVNPRSQQRRIQYKMNASSKFNLGFFLKHSLILKLVGGPIFI